MDATVFEFDLFDAPMPHAPERAIMGVTKQSHNLIRIGIGAAACGGEQPMENATPCVAGIDERRIHPE